jgi:Protein of unknown function (DUF3987)
VRTIAPQSEADPVALLAQILDYFGVIIGRTATFDVEVTRHHTNIFTCLVGASARARKGTSFDYMERIFSEVDATWSLDNLSGGCGSGEGLIAAVRDASYKREAIKDKGRVVDYQEVETDPGVQDKRLLVYEAEFSSLLKVASREGNILSEILRKAWETGNLRNTVKVAPMKATGAHIAIVGHITIEELQRTLTTTDAANGFGNRFLWVCVRRAQHLPEGSAFPTQAMAPLIAQLTQAVKVAKTVTTVQRDEEARAAWKAVYAALTEDHPGLVGTLIARAEAQVVRLSMLYALLDGSATIRADHLYAALAFWEYCEASVRYLFGSSLGDTQADALLAALQDCAPRGLSRKQILHSVFQRHLRADELDRILRLFERRRLIRIEHAARTTGSGRGKELIYAMDCDLCDLSDLSSTDYVSISKAAVKRLHQRSHESGDLCDLSSDGAPPPEDAEPGGCLHEHLNDAGHCNDCGELVSEIPPSVEPVTMPPGGAESAEPTGASAPTRREKQPLSHTKKGMV